MKTRFPHITRIICWAIIICGLSFSCQQEKTSYSDILNLTFLPDNGGTFRGVRLQDDISIVKRNENPNNPSYEDPLGIVYTHPLSENEELIIEYYTPLVANGVETNQITAIVANLLLHDPVLTDQLYKEFESYFSTKYGFPTGKYGNYIWEGIVQKSTNTGMEIILKIDGSKNKISINFIDQQLN